MISSIPVAARSRFATVLFLVLFALLTISASPVSADSTQTREIAAQKHIDQKLQVWQQRLNLKDWNLRARLVHPDALEPKTLGNIRWNTDARAATIGVLSTYHYDLQDQAMLDDMEFTIVHELVHLHLASLPRSEASRRVEEHAVNELAKALLNLAKR
jgi:hypothetical protein